MKISHNMSEVFFAWQVRGLRIVAVLMLLSALLFRQHFIDLTAGAAVVLLVSTVMASRRAHFLLEVHDFDDYLLFKLDNNEATLNLSDIEKVKIRDGDDGLDWIIMNLHIESRFGRVIQFYPDMVRMPEGRPDRWVVRFNQRISAARQARRPAASP
jgi:hypothetical protein